MKYIDVKQQLINNGFTPEYIQSSNTNLESITFINPDINGEIEVQFVEPENEDDIPDIIDYTNSEFINNSDVKLISFNFNNLITSYMSESILDIYGDRDNNCIILSNHNGDIDKLFEKSVSIISNRDNIMKYLIEYHNMVSIFLNEVQNISSKILADSKTNFGCYRINGNKDCMCPSIEVEYSIDNNYVLIFTMETLSFEKRIGIGTTSDIYTFTMNDDVNKLKQIYDGQLVIWNKTKKRHFR